MAKYYYKRSAKRNLKIYLRLTSIVFLIVGISIISYILLPALSWQIYFQSTFASQNITSSIPRASIVDLATNFIDKTNYYKAENWFPKFNPNSSGQKKQGNSIYAISIPIINIREAIVSTIDTDLTKHLVNYPGTGIPGKNGNAVIFGHSTLPQLFNPKDYKTIFANAYKLKNENNIYAQVNGVTYTYKIFNITVVDPEDSSALEQNYDNSYLTLVTCTPPGTTWKRLIVKARLEKI